MVDGLGPRRFPGPLNPFDFLFQPRILVVDREQAGPLFESFVPPSRLLGAARGLLHDRIGEREFVPDKPQFIRNGGLAGIALQTLFQNQGAFRQIRFSGRTLPQRLQVGPFPSQLRFALEFAKQGMVGKPRQVRRTNPQSRIEGAICNFLVGSLDIREVADRLGG